MSLQRWTTLPANFWLSRHHQTNPPSPIAPPPSEFVKNCGGRSASSSASALFTCSWPAPLPWLARNFPGCATGEWGRFSPALVSGRSLAAVAYLVVFGSLVAFTAYVWLLRTTSPALASTYAFVNPVVAVFLGWALAAEQVSLRTLAAAAVIVGAVVLITLGESSRRSA